MKLLDDVTASGQGPWLDLKPGRYLLALDGTFDGAQVQILIRKHAGAPGTDFPGNSFAAPTHQRLHLDHEVQVSALVSLAGEITHLNAWLYEA